MQLYYDERDDKTHELRGSRILYWLDDLGAQPISEATENDVGFLFAGARPIDDYRELTRRFPGIRDLPEDREAILTLDRVLDAMSASLISVPTPKTWKVRIDEAYPEDLTYPLFLRTAVSSWKLGGQISRVRSLRELEEQSAALRRAFGWDAMILARAWHELAVAGQSPHGPVPQELRVWIVDQIPFAWSFHYLNVLSAPRGFPPMKADVQELRKFAAELGTVFRSRLIAADFARQKNGEWILIEAGPGSCAGTAHESVFKAVALRLRGEAFSFRSDAVGGVFDE